MTATNMCSNFGSKWCSPPLMVGVYGFKFSIMHLIVGVVFKFSIMHLMVGVVLNSA